MLHEALFYLWNFPGDLYASGGEDFDTCNVELESFLHPGEKTLLKRIMEIANKYHKIQAFVNKILFSSTNESGNTVTVDNNIELKTGLYIKAFCDGVDIVLDDYRNEIIALESAILSNPQVSLSYVFGRIDSYAMLLNTLTVMINVIKEERVHGCLILGRLMQYTQGGICEESCTKVLHAVNKVFYKHLCNWLIYGSLDDACDEFFIYDGKCADSDFLYPEQMCENDAETSKFIKKLKYKNPPKIQKFCIRREMLPVYLHEVTAQKILFMGRMVWVMRNDPGRCEGERKFQRDIWGGREMEYFKKLQHLAGHKFNLTEFNGAIEECRLRLSNYLWTVVVEEAHLLDHLQLIREYFALGRGELFQQFIVAAEDQIAETPNDYLITKINSIFLETARKMYNTQDNAYQKIILLLPNGFNKDSNVWEQLEIMLSISWPLHMLFHPKSMELYNKLFCFLLKVKKSHVDLNRLWLLHMEGKRKVDVGVWTLRNKLMFIINNLQYYLQVDVIEAQFSVLKNAIVNAGEFENIIKLHAKFQTDLLSRAFIMELNESNASQDEYNIYQVPRLNYENSMHLVHKTLIYILELCDQFCIHANSWDSTLTAPQRDELTAFQDRFEVTLDCLLNILYSLREQTIGNHLLQLLNRLDFNRWYSKNKPDFNMSVIS